MKTSQTRKIKENGSSNKNFKDNLSEICKKYKKDLQEMFQDYYQKNFKKNYEEAISKITQTRISSSKGNSHGNLYKCYSQFYNGENNKGNLKDTNMFSLTKYQNLILGLEPKQN